MHPDDWSLTTGWDASRLARRNIAPIISSLSASMSRRTPTVLHYRLYDTCHSLRPRARTIRATKIAPGNSRPCPHIVSKRTTLRNRYGPTARRQTGATVRTTPSEVPSEVPGCTRLTSTRCLPCARAPVPGMVPAPRRHVHLTPLACASRTIRRPVRLAPGRCAIVFKLTGAPSWQKKNSSK